MSNISVDEFLAHYGVKGMKWGVRSDRGHEGQKARTKKIEKLDKKFQRNSQSYKITAKIYNSAADATNKNDIARINNKPEYKGQNFSRDSPLRQKYYKEHQDAFLDNLEKAAKDLGTNASGTQRYGILEKDRGGWDVVIKDVKHADEPVFRVKVKYDSMGHILSMELDSDTLEQSDPIEDILAHYGVLGMKWGKRKSRSAPSQDHVTSRETKKKRLDEMSNAELKQLVTRLNLEKQYADLANKAPKSETRKFVEGLAKQQVTSLVAKNAPLIIDKALKVYASR